MMCVFLFYFYFAFLCPLSLKEKEKENNFVLSYFTCNFDDLCVSKKEETVLQIYWTDPFNVHFATVGSFSILCKNKS